MRRLQHDVSRRGLIHGTSAAPQPQGASVAPTGFSLLERVYPAFPRRDIPDVSHKYLHTKGRATILWGQSLGSTFGAVGEYLMTRDQLLEVMPLAGKRIDSFLTPLNAAMDESSGKRRGS